MLKMTVQEIAKVVHGTIIGGDPLTEVTGAASDSRQAQYGDLFVPLKGERVDGHCYIEQAFANGAAAALTSQEHVPGKGPLIFVTDTLQALQDLARYHLASHPVKIVAVTGSVGKTTTKDMVAAVLSEKLSVLKSQGNLNTEVGLPLTLFNLGPEHEVAVLEMGMRGKGEIAELCRIARPDIAVLTNISEVHIELLGSIENIALAKAEILEALDVDGLAILNADDPWIMKMMNKTKGKVWTYGVKQRADFAGRGTKALGLDGSQFELSTPEYQVEAQVPLPGEHNVYNALAAAAVGYALGLNGRQIVDGLKAFQPSSQRMNIETLPNGALLINDTYNAGPKSMLAALSILAEIKENRPTIAVLGDMLELGDTANQAHLEVGAHVQQLGIDTLITRGELARVIAQGALQHGMSRAKVFATTTNDEAERALLSHLSPQSVVLIKGSRGMAMEEIVAGLKHHLMG